MSLELSINERALIVRAICPLELSIALLFPLEELSRVLSAAAIFAPDLLSIAVLGIVEPLTGISNTLSCIKEAASASCLVIGPLSNVYITICLSHLAFALEESIPELSLILRPIWVELNAESIFLIGSHIPIYTIVDIFTYHWPLYLTPLLSESSIK